MLFPKSLITLFLLAISPHTTAFVLPFHPSTTLHPISTPSQATPPPTVLPPHPTLEPRKPKTTLLLTEADISAALASIHVAPGSVTRSLPSLIKPYFWSIPVDSEVHWTPYSKPATTWVISSLMWPSHTASPSPTLKPREEARVTEVGPQFSEVFTAEIVNPSFTVDIVNVPGPTEGAIPTVTDGRLPEGTVFVVPAPSVPPPVLPFYFPIPSEIASAAAPLISVSLEPFVRPTPVYSTDATASYLSTKVNVFATHTSTVTGIILPTPTPFAPFLPATPLPSPSSPSTTSHLPPAAIAAIVFGVLAVVGLGVAAGVWGLMRFRKARRARDEEVARRGEWYGRDVEAEVQRKDEERRKREMHASFWGGKDEEGKDGKEREGKDGKEIEMVDVDLSDLTDKDGEGEGNKKNEGRGWEGLSRSNTLVGGGEAPRWA
ncbi:Mucin-2 [Trapelia coarctata]|nr:Mucin-2 [Trapelia coarctata]